MSHFSGLPPYSLSLPFLWHLLLVFNYSREAAQHHEFAGHFTLQYGGHTGTETATAHCLGRPHLPGNRNTSCLMLTPPATRDDLWVCKSTTAQIQSSFTLHNSKSQRKLHFAVINSWLPGLGFILADQ